MGDLTTAYNRVIAACNDAHIGYSQGARTTIRLNVEYNTYCDCSSLISWAMTEAGYFSVNPWFYTGNQRQLMLQAGWTEFDPQSTSWQPGDVLWIESASHQHTEMVWGECDGSSGITMGAHTSNRAFADQVSINNYRSSGSQYQILLRDLQGGSVNPVYWFQPSEQRYLTSDEMWNNAACVYNHLRREGFSNESIAGILGNMQRESTINPNIWENLTVGTGGYGLVGWTPASNYRNWATEHGINMEDANANGNGQCDFLVESAESLGYWLKNPSKGYTYTWEEFKKLTSATEAAAAFCWEYERPGVPALEDRKRFAEYWLTQIPLFPSDVGSPIGRYAGYIFPGIINDLRYRKIIPMH